MFVGDALAMPVHWCYDVAALHRDFGTIRDYRAEGFSSEFHRGPGQYQPGRARFAGRRSGRRGDPQGQKTVLGSAQHLLPHTFPPAAQAPSAVFSII
jgi:hypothetical protein